MELIHGFITYGICFLAIWCTFIAVGEIYILNIIKKARGKCRRADILRLLFLVTSIFAAGFVLFVQPGLAYSVPSAIVCLEVGSIWVLFYLSDLLFKTVGRVRHITPR